LAIVTTTTTNIYPSTDTLPNHDSNSVALVLRSGVAGSYGSSACKFLMFLHLFFHRSCTALHSHQQGTKFPISPRPCQHLPFL
jgi:hypothetical protein